MYADISLTHAVMVAVVQVPVLVLWYSTTQYDKSNRTDQQAIPGAALASGLVRKLPSHDGGLVEVAGDKGFDVALVRCLYARIGIEQVVVGGIQDLFDIDVHATIVGPIVGQGNNKTKAMRLRRGDDVI